jgi:ubiquinone biosynthesis protein
MHPVAVRFAWVLQRLGTTFVKLGQHLSLRADLLPEEAQRALARLQTHVDPFPAEQAVREIETALGVRLADRFARFDMTPLAAASVAQIHRAALPDRREVVVKVRRPGAAEQAEADMRILRGVARTLEWLVPSLRRWSLVAVVDEIAGNIRLEMDLAREARSVRRFADAWLGSADIAIPDVVDGLCTPTVMVQEFSAGLAPEDLPPEAREPTARRLVDSYVVQIFRDGLFHGDPHPGNIFAMPDGRVCLHDFGIVGRVDRRMRRALAAFALAFVEQDADWVVDAWFDLGLVGERTDRAVFVPVVQSLLADCAERPLRDWSLSNALGQLVAAGRSSDVRLPHDLLVLTRTMLLLDGTVRALSPDFSIVDTISRQVASGVLDQKSAAPASKRLPYELGNAATDLPALLARRLHGALGSRRMFELGIVPDPRLEAGIERASRRIALALVTLGLYIASSLLMQHGVGPRWGDMPVLALAGYALAIRFTLSLARGRH